MAGVMAPVRTRCLVVAAGSPSPLWGAATVLGRQLTAAGRCLGGPRTSRWSGSAWSPPGGVAWGWLQGLAAVVEAWRGVDRIGTRPGAVRRVVLAACGVAVVSVLAVRPAQAAPGHADGPDVLTGLPLPSGPSAPAHATGPRRRGPQPGDSLWSLAAARPAATCERGRHRRPLATDLPRNRGVIGADPDLIRPGQLLRRLPPTALSRTEGPPCPHAAVMPIAPSSACRWRPSRARSRST